jgi:hypothetical protein
LATGLPAELSPYPEWRRAARTSRGRVATCVAALLFGLTLSAQKTESEVLFISATKIEPAVISRPAGSFMLLIKNYSSLQHLVIHIAPHGGGAELLHADLDTRNGSYATVLNLASGTYDVTEPGHSSLTSKLVIK